MFLQGEYPSIKVAPPGPNARKILKEDQKYLMQSFHRFYPLVVKRAKGFLVEDVDGNIYIDLNAGIAVAVTGHCHPHVVEAIKRRSEELLHYSITDFVYEDPVLLARKLSEITPGSFQKKIFFGNSGTEAVEGGIKVARGYFEGRRPIVFAFIGSFHGRSLGSLSLTASKPVQRRWFQPLLPCVEHVPYPYCYRCPWKQTFPDCDYWCIDFIEEWYFRRYVPAEEVSAFVFEPISGEGGYVVPPEGYWRKLKRLADKYGILLIDDEVQAGMGRTGKWFAIEHWGIAPDILLVAKGIASGLPLSAVIGREDLMNLPPGSHASTFGGNPISCSAALATIEVIERENLLENARKVGEHVLKRLQEMYSKYDIIGDVRGKGLMIGAEIVEDKDNKKPAPKVAQKIMEESFKRGVLLITAGLSTLRFSPPLIISLEAMDKALNIIEEVIKNVSRNTLH